MVNKRTPLRAYAVILAGGVGKRLFPLSKPSLPKPFLSVTKDNKTIFRKTIDRIKKIIPERNIAVVASRRSSRLVKNNFPNISKDNLLLEKVPRNTAPAIALAALALKNRCPDTIMIVLPADHYIGYERAYLNTIEKGIDFVDRNPNALVTVGLKPIFPATGYGYIRIEGRPPYLKPCRAGGSRRKIYKVAGFIEKPDIKTAEKFLKDGTYLWNTGTFIFKAATFLDAIRTFASDIYGGLKDLRKIDERYETLPNISVDYAIMEKANNIYCIEGYYLWEDIGSFDSLKKVLSIEGKRFVEKDGKVVRIL